MDGMNNPLEKFEKPSEDWVMEARVAVLEHIAASTKEAIVDLRDEMRQERRANHEQIDRLQRSTTDQFQRIQDQFQRIQDQFQRVQQTADRDFRVLFGALIATAIGLSTMMAKGFHWF